MDLWCPFADRDEIPGVPGAGSFTGGGWKIVHHTTEGSSYAGARATYAKTRNLPHFTDSFEDGVYQVRQHLPLNIAATALAHPKGTGPTNTDHAIQIEHVGFTAHSAELADAFLVGIAILCRWIEATVGVSRTAVGFGFPRMAWRDWHAYSGHCGHMHVPNNSHVDPGNLNFGRILTAGQPLPGPVPAPTPTIDIPEEGPMQRFVLDAGNLDDQGNGVILFDGGATNEPGVAHFQAIPWPNYRHVVPQGSFPPVDGYRGLPKIGVQERDGWLCVEMQGGPAHGAVTLVVDVAA